MPFDTTTLCIAFAGSQVLASGPLAQVAPAVKQAFDADTSQSVLIFDATTSVRIDLDLGGSVADVCQRIPFAAAAEVRGPGRPKLGVVPREVTLLPRHWEWLATQPGGASVTLRKLVEAARKTSACDDDLRKGKDAIYKFMTAIGGDFAGYEEATRALYGADQQKFTGIIEAWPTDVRVHLAHLAKAAFVHAASDA
jgi:uncharacterized protein